MQSEKIDGLIYDSGNRCFFRGSMTYKNGRVCAFDRTDSGGDDLILPGFVDIHTHGRAGFDFDSVSAENIALMCRSYAALGTTTVLPTIASAPLEVMENAICEIKKAAMTNSDGAKIAGIHLEGRWLNPKRRGAHAAELLALPDVGELERLVGMIRPLVPYVTVAAELDGGEDFVRRALELGCVVSLGHTDADYATALRLYSLGIRSATHLYNAMSPLHHRDPGAVGASLFSDVYTELICDGFHIHPRMIKFTVDTKSRDRVVLITDSMMAAGCADGRYHIAGSPVNVKNGHALGEDGTICGSTLDLYTALLNVREFTGLTLEEAVPFATSNPAALLGIAAGELKIGAPCDYVVLDRETMAIKQVNIAR